MKDATLKKITWKSTEHNIAVYSAFMKLFDVTNASIWRDRAFHARDFAEAMWDTNGGHFWTGTMDDGVQINKWVYPLDVNTLGLIFLGGMYAPGIEWAYKNCLVNTCPHGDPFKGFDFNDDIDGVWPEGSAQMCVSFCMMNDTSRYGEYIQQLRLMQSLAKHNNGKGIVEACHDTVTSGFEGINKINRLSVAATSWYIFAEQPCAKLTNIFSESNIPIVYSLSQNYPNPLSPSTTITYQLPKASPVTLELYNVIGQRVKILVDEWQHAGQYSIQWDGKNSSGFHIANGVYYYRIVAGSFVDTKSAILIR